MTVESPTTDPVRPARAFTPRAVGIGVALALTLAWVAPWNDWYLDNSYLFNNYLPPTATTVLLVLALVVNPLLGRRRLGRGELAVITALVLAVAGVASSGFARYWSIVVAGPARKLVRQPDEALRLPMDQAELARVVASLRAEFTADFAAVDADGDQRIRADEAWGAATVARDDRDGDGALDADEYVAGRLAHDARAHATWRWALPPALFLGVPAAGATDTDDAEYQHVVDGYIDGAGRTASCTRTSWRCRAGNANATRAARSSTSTATSARRWPGCARDPVSSRRRSVRSRSWRSSRR
ncbi:MAG TPA: DUF6785 family protein, partial [Planctomycetota bacterium]|nr:DUF6785 family protein [Planctomycetota bacterium]